MTSYSIPSSFCSTADTTEVPDNIAVENGTTSTNWLKIIFVILGITVGIFVILVVIFAVKAKMKQEQEEKEENKTA